jgi:hypothetical protein
VGKVFEKRCQGDGVNEKLLPAAGKSDRPVRRAPPIDIEGVFYLLQVKVFEAYDESLVSFLEH